MKNKTRNLILLVVFFLISLTIIQFVWMLRAATYQEKQFEFSVVAAINKSIIEINKQHAVCMQVTSCFDKVGFTCCNEHDISSDKWNYIDSLIKVELAFSKICINYEFKLSITPHPHPMDDKVEGKHKCFTVKSNMETTNGDSIWLHVTFPNRNKFIMAQIGWIFILSIVLILLTIGAFLLIYRYYIQEQLLASDTRNFINNLTHEFKTPLSSIRLANSRIIKTKGCSDKTSTYTKIIKQENDKLDRHINYLLDISRLQKGKMPMNIELLDIYNLLIEQTDSFTLRIEERDGSLSINNEAKNTWVNADCFHLSNIITNILDNACKYTTKQPEINITVINKKSSLIIAFSDNGIGIDKSNQKIIFQEFSRVDTGNIHNVKGFGLGLSYVGQVVKLHKGKIWLESKKGEGTTFFVQIPLAEKH